MQSDDNCKTDSDETTVVAGNVTLVKPTPPPSGNPTGFTDDSFGINSDNLDASTPNSGDSDGRDTTLVPDVLDDVQTDNASSSVSTKSRGELRRDLYASQRLVEARTTERDTAQAQLDTAQATILALQGTVATDNAQGRWKNCCPCGRRPPENDDHVEVPGSGEGLDDDEVEGTGLDGDHGNVDGAGRVEDSDGSFSA